MHNLIHLVQPGYNPIDMSLESKVYQTLFGFQSKLFLLFQEKLDISIEEYLLFLITLLKSCCYCTSVKNLNASEDKFFLMPTAKYNSIWRSIATLERAGSGLPFWQEVEALLNNKYMDLFLGGHHKETKCIKESLTFLLGLDDDKLHFNHSKQTDTDGLKKDHHAKDNRRGFTAHPCCFSAMCVPDNVSFQ